MKQRMWHRLCTHSLGALAVILTHTALAQNFAIQGIRYTGTGCPANSVGTYISEDRQVMTLAFDKYMVDLSEGPRVPTLMKNCLLTVKVSLPRGYKMGLIGADIRGFAELTDGVRGTQAIHYRFTGTPPVYLPPLVLRGPLADNYLHSVALPTNRTQWSSCGTGGSRFLYLLTQVRLDTPRPNRVGVMSVDTLDQYMQHSYKIKWTSCRPSREEEKPEVEEANREDRF